MEFLGGNTPSLHHCKVDTTVTMAVCLCILIAWIIIFALAVILPLNCEKWANTNGRTVMAGPPLVSLNKALLTLISPGGRVG